MKPFLISLGITLALGAGIFFILNPDFSAYDVESEVIAAAQISVKSQLKAPSTARFSGSKETQVKDLGDDTYIVTGWVEAQNSFGAMVRSSFSVKLIFKDGVSTILYCNIS